MTSAPEGTPVAFRLWYAPAAMVALVYAGLLRALSLLTAPLTARRPRRHAFPHRPAF